MKREIVEKIVSNYVDSNMADIKKEMKKGSVFMVYEYIYNKEGYLKCILGVFDYCKANNLACHIVDQEDNDYVFTIKIHKDAVLDIYTVVESVHGLDLVKVQFVPNSVHRRNSKNKLKTLKQAIGTLLQSDDEIEGVLYRSHISTLISLFNTYLSNFDKLIKDLNLTDINIWMNKYIESNNLKLYSFKYKEKSGLKVKVRTYNCNLVSEGERVVTIYNTFDKRDNGQEIKGKFVAKSVNNEVKRQAYYAYIESEILPNYDKRDTENKTDSEKIKELEIILANKCRNKIED